MLWGQEDNLEDNQEDNPSFPHVPQHLWDTARNL